jgi:hypothetical protein
MGVSRRAVRTCDKVMRFLLHLTRFIYHTLNRNVR